MANEFVARKGIISLGDLTVDTLSGNNGEIVTLDAAGKMVASGTSISGINGTVTSVTVGTGLDVANGTTTPLISLDLTEITLGAGLDSTATGLTLDLSELADMTTDIVGTADELILLDAGVQKRKLTSEIKLGQFNNDQGWTSNVGDITGVTAGTGLTGGATSGTATVSVDYAGTDNFILSATDGTSLGNLEGGDKIAFVDTDNDVKYAEISQLPFNNFTYTHPTHPGDDISVDTGALTGATVISDLDFNVTTDGLGHVTDANAAISTRNLTLADLGYTGTTDANTYVHPNHTGDVTSSGDGATTLAAAAITGKTALTTGLVSTDEFLVSDAGTLKRMDTSVLQTYMQSNLTFTTNTDVDVSVANLTTRLGQIPGNATIGGGSSTITIPGDLVVTGTTTTNNVETVSTSNGVIFEGNAADANELTLLAGTLTADQTVTLPDATGTLALDNGSYPNLRAQATTKADVGLGNVENTALSTWAGSSNITTLGTIATGVWQGSAISTTYISNLSGTNTGDEPDASATVKGIIEIATNAEVTAGTDTVRAITPSSLTSITKLGTIGTGTWQGTSISTTYTAAKVTSVAAGAGIDVSSTTGAVTVSAEAASATNPGVIEIATNAEVTTGTDTVRAITPSSLTSITKLGTIGTGTWQGTKIASAYLDNDTAHLSTTQTFTGTKTFTSKVVLDTDSGDNVDLFTDYTATVAASSVTTIASYTSAAAVAVYFDYRINDATTNLRAGTVMAISNGSTVAYTEYSTGDIGDTSAVILSVDYSGGAIRLRAQNDAGASFRANVFVRTV